MRPDHDDSERRKSRKDRVVQDEEQAVVLIRHIANGGFWCGNQQRGQDSADRRQSGQQDKQRPPSVRAHDECRRIGRHERAEPSGRYEAPVPRPSRSRGNHVTTAFIPARSAEAVPAPSSARPIARPKGPVDRPNINAPSAVTPIITDWTTGPKSIDRDAGGQQAGRESQRKCRSQYPERALTDGQIGHQIIGND